MKHAEKIVFLGGIKNISGKRIRDARLNCMVGMRKLSQTELAEMVSRQGSSMNRIALGRIENGSRTVTDVELLAFARALGVDVRTLLFDLPQRNAGELRSVPYETLKAAS